MTVGTAGVTGGVEQRSRPGRQRSEAADQAILAATLEVLAEMGYAGLTMSAVISSAGVSSATLYRRWPTKQELVAAALASMHAEIVDIDTGTFEGDIAEMVEAIADAMSLRREELSEDLVIELRRSPEFRAAITEKFITPRRRVMGAIVNRAIARGDVGAELDQGDAMAFVSGPIHNRIYVQGGVADPEFRRRVAIGATAAILAIAPLSPR